MKSLLSNAVRSSAVRVRPGGLAISQSRKITVKEMQGARAVGDGGGISITPQSRDPPLLPRPPHQACEIWSFSGLQEQRGWELILSAAVWGEREPWGQMPNGGWQGS